MKIINNIILIAYGILSIPLLMILLTVLPIMTISDGVEIISTGYTVTGDYMALLMGTLFFVYISLRFRNLRRIYKIFPSWFEFVKYTTIASVFIYIGAEILNWSYIKLDPVRQRFGVVIFIVSLILWRVFVSIYYSKKPIVDFMPKAEEKIKNYNQNS